MCMLCLRDALLNPRLRKLVPKHLAVLLRRPSFFVLKEPQNFHAYNTIVTSFSRHRQITNAVKHPVNYWVSRWWWTVRWTHAHTRTYSRTRSRRRSLRLSTVSKKIFWRLHAQHQARKKFWCCSGVVGVKKQVCGSQRSSSCLAVECFEQGKIS